MTKEFIFISIGYMDKTKPSKYDPVRRYFMKLHAKDMREIMQYLAHKAHDFDPMKEWKN